MLSIVYVFVCGNPGLLGFSVDKRGINLPLTSTFGPAHHWSRAYEIEMTEAAFCAFMIDGTIAIADLISCGYHVARSTPDANALPKHHRSSS
ncbi:hypothetical protein HYPDE_26523 [Hyphomicrobium denitrificans 1NES1]|uniref:Uncharacterized protein n=1 Tax=Hyphomicrobium denitrificans 1NES1 TaxID=670307 RepID=N0BA61_9HYPH|nr:hypothetical protein HYPDE_26523 [Hyphomicrobium denitrificans 1NES1]